MTNPTVFSLAGSTALITGGGSGLGFAMAQCLLAAGASVVIAGQTEKKLIQATAALGKNASYQVADINNARAVSDLLDVTLARHGGLDILINNAGNHVKKPIDAMNSVDFRSVLDTHVVAAFDLTRAALPLLRKSPNASVLFIASMASYLSIPSIIGYTAAKAAVLGLVRGAAAELGPENIRVNAIAPGWISSPMTDRALSTDPARKAKVLSRTPLGHLGEAADIGWAAVYLSSAAAKFVHGHTLVVDGGAVSGF